MQPNIAYDYESPCNELTLAHASKLVPEEYRAVWSWYLSMEGESIGRLPMGDSAPSGLPVKVCSQRGIHKPADGDLAHGWPNGRAYALTIHSASGGRYNDQVIYRPDGTWTFEYDEQVTEQGREQQWDHNSPLMNCLEDGVPVGVIVGKQQGYVVMGLAFVERYDPSSGRFSLHGPVNAGTDSGRQFFSFVDADLSEKDLCKLEELKRLSLTDGDERLREFTRQIKRERQRQFSRAVFAAYGGRCAISDVGVPDTLQAAHIDDYRSRKSQIVQNGILLRADLHLLYDANLLGIKPGSHELVLADSARVNPYRGLIDSRQVLRPPNNPALRPDDELLDIHYQQFLIKNHAA